jgi:hypothetical protein
MGSCRIVLLALPDEPLVLRKVTLLTEAHRALIRLLARESVEEFLREQELTDDAVEDQ